jgi:hypothetical protein
MEVVQYIMVTARYLEDRFLKPRRERLRAEALTEGRAEGRTEVQEIWEAWNRRRMDAEAKEESFDEPPPKLDA